MLAICVIKVHLCLLLLLLPCAVDVACVVPVITEASFYYLLLSEVLNNTTTKVIKTFNIYNIVVSLYTACCVHCYFFPPSFLFCHITVHILYHHSTNSVHTVFPVKNRIG